MKRRALLVVSGSVLLGSGCTGTQPTSNDASPTSVSSPTSGTTDESGSETASETPDCRIADLNIYNDRSEPATISVRLIEGRGRYRGGSPTPEMAESPTETPIVIFEHESSIPGQDSQEYYELPHAEGPHRLEVSVADGLSEIDHIDARKWGGSNIVTVDLNQSAIEFSYSTAGLSTECAGRSGSPPESSK